MKKSIMLLVAMVFAALALAGCAVPTPAPKDMQAVQAQIVKACAIVQPTLVSVQALATTPEDQAKMAEIVQINGAACSASTLDITNLHAVADKAVPYALDLIKRSKLSDADKQRLQTELMILQIAVSTAIAQYGS